MHISPQCLTALSSEAEYHFAPSVPACVVLSILRGQLALGLALTEQPCGVRRRMQHDGVPADQRVPVAVCPRDANRNDLRAGGPQLGAVHVASRTCNVACCMSCAADQRIRIHIAVLLCCERQAISESIRTGIGRNCGPDRSRSCTRRPVLQAHRRVPCGRRRLRAAQVLGGAPHEARGLLFKLTRRTLVLFAV